MSILVNRQTGVIVQGITGREGSFHTEQMLSYGTRVLGGVTPGKGGQTIAGVPVFNAVREAVDRTGATASVLFVPAFAARAAVVEAAEAGIKLIVCITEGIPTQDMIVSLEIARSRGARLIGPNCPGLATVGETKIGIIPGNIFLPGRIGLASRSGTLTYEIVQALSREGLGQSTCVGLGGDPLLGTRFLDVLPLFEEDPGTDAIILIGEIGGADEEAAAAFLRTMKKPVVGLISGRTAPKGRRMGHAGAIISGNQGTAESKEKAWREAGVRLARTTAEIPRLVQEALKEQAARGRR